MSQKQIIVKSTVPLKRNSRKQHSKDIDQAIFYIYMYMTKYNSHSYYFHLNEILRQLQKVFPTISKDTVQKHLDDMILRKIFMKEKMYKNKIPYKATEYTEILLNTHIFPATKYMNKIIEPRFRIRIINILNMLLILEDVSRDDDKEVVDFLRAENIIKEKYNQDKLNDEYKNIINQWSYRYVLTEPYKHIVRQFDQLVNILTEYLRVLYHETGDNEIKNWIVSIYGKDTADQILSRDIPVYTLSHKQKQELKKELDTFEAEPLDSIVWNMMDEVVQSGYKLIK